MLRLLALALVFSAPATHADLNSLVQNGATVPTNHESSRSIALMQMASGASCTASFLSPTILLTAAHCADDPRASQVDVRIRDAQGRWHVQTVRRLIVHPEYSIKSTSEGYQVRADFALIELTAPMPIPVRVLQVADPSSLTGTQFQVTVAGYGRLRGTSGIGVLRSGEMISVIEQSLAFLNYFGLIMVPADADQQATCPGDSGGPVLYGDLNSRLLIGVHSLSSGCQGRASESVSYSQIPAQEVRWINSYL